MIENKSCPIWDYDDISECARQEYIDFKFPLIILLIDLIYTFLKIFYALQLKREYYGSESALDYQCETPELEVQNNESNKDARFSVLRLKSAWENRCFRSVKYKRSSFDKFKVFIEGVLNVLQFIIHLYILIDIPADGKIFFHQSLVVKILLWVLLLIIVSLRLFSVSQSLRWLSACQHNLWTVSFLSYTLIFALSIPPLYSILIGKIRDVAVTKYFIIEFSINLALFLLLFTSNIEGINYSFLVEDEKENLPPNTTVFGLLTFARIDRLIWKACKRYLENADIWDLDINNKSVVILTKFEKYFKHRKILSSVVSYFKITFFSQLLLAFVTSLLNFVPSLLLPKILTYVDDPQSQSWNLISLYVTFMLVSKVIATTCRGQGLFLGEKGTMQLRTVLISHIYSKTLRRTILKGSAMPKQENHSQPNVLTTPEENDDYSEMELDAKTSRKDNSINNIMSVDAFKVSEAMSTFYQACEAIFMTVTALIILYLSLIHIFYPFLKCELKPFRQRLARQLRSRV